MVLLFQACECFLETSGFVLDKETNLPLDSVKVEVYLKQGKREKEFYKGAFTDTSGAFMFGGMYGSGFRDCPQISIQLSKDGYKKLDLPVTWQDTIYMEK